MKQYGKRFTYFVSLLVSGYLFWGRRIYIHWPIKWPLGIFNGGAAWSLLALANVCLCVIEYFMGSSKFNAQLYRFLVSPFFLFFCWKTFENMYSIHYIKPTLMFVLRLFISGMCLSYAFICWLFLFQLTFTLCFNILSVPNEFLSFAVRVLALHYLYSGRDSFT